MRQQFTLSAQASSTALPLEWVDLTAPDAAELALAARDYSLPESLVLDCLDPEHLPKFEQVGGTGFIIVRAYDSGCRSDADEVQELTRKVAVFFDLTPPAPRPPWVLTIHRAPMAWMDGLPLEAERSHDGGAELIARLLRAVVTTFDAPLDRCFDELEAIETKILDTRPSSGTLLRRGYYLKRKASVIKRISRLSLEVIRALTPELARQGQATLAQDLRERLESTYFYADQLVDDAQNLLNFHLSLASQRTNEVVRVLTLFSVFFLPLNFIASIYGMNFEHMPELKFAWGYPAVLTAMAVVAVSLVVWFRRNRWL